MNARSALIDFQVVRRLQAAGIPLDPHAVETMKVSVGALLLGESPTWQSGAYALNSGGAAYVVDLIIQNDSEQPVRLDQARINLPWWWQNLRLVKPDGMVYLLPPPAPSFFGKEAVLNHFLGRRSKLLPGDCIEGSLLAVSDSPIPAEYQDRQRFQLELSVFDSRSNKWSLELELPIIRPPQRTTAFDRSIRKSLLSQGDNSVARGYESKRLPPLAAARAGERRPATLRGGRRGASCGLVYRKAQRVVKP